MTGGDMSDELDEIWALYADDGVQSLDVVEDSLVRLNTASADADTIAALFRAVHTFKGNARVLGLAVIESRAHKAEDLIGLVRDEGVALDAEMLAMLLEAADALRCMLEESVAHRRDVASEVTDDLARRMQEMVEHRRRQEVAPQAEDQPEPVKEPEPEMATGSAENVEMPESVIFEPAPKSRLADDPMYRDIFSAMVLDVVSKIRPALDAFQDSPQEARSLLASEVEGLRYAAEQIDMPEWPEVLIDFLELSEPSAEEAGALLAQMVRMCERDFQTVIPVTVNADAEIHQFFNDLEPLLATVSAFGIQISAGEAVNLDEIRQTTEGIKGLAAPHGFVRLADVADQLAANANSQEYQRVELTFYEELASIETATSAQGHAARVKPTAMLRTWCADRVFDSLLELGKLLDEFKKHEDVSGLCAKFNELMRHICHACHHHRIETAAHLSMSLIDLFSRVQSGEMPPDPVLPHIARSFVASMELVFDAVGSGDAPDMANIEKLLEEAASVTFIVSGTASSTAVEARLGLPKSFHKVLTPESVKAAVAAMEAEHFFYIVRADLNQDEAVACKFLEWIGSGIATAISNVTVFERDTTLFDFLLATPLDQIHLAEAMAVLDPTGSFLKVEMELADRRKGGDGAHKEDETTGGAEIGASRNVVGQDAISGDMLEAIGEVVAGQAMVHHMLSDLAEEDLVRAVETEMRNAGGDWSKAQGAVRRTLENFSARIEGALQSGAQLNTQLCRLQEEAIALRTRSATLLLKPLEAFAEATARQHGRQIAVFCVGEDLALDHTMLESLKAPLRSLVAFCVTQSIEPPERRVAMGKEGRGQLRIGLARQDDHVTAIVEDDGSDVAESADFEDIRAGLRSQGGDLRVVMLPTGGIRFHVTLPMAMVVLDGMVVRVGEVRYIVPLDAIQRIVHSGVQEIMRVSADHGQYMLKLGGEDVVPIQFLSGSDDDNDLRAVVGEDTRRLFVVVGNQSQRSALSVDELLGQQVVLIRPLRGYLSGIRGVTGCALLGGGEVGMVLDMGHVLSLAG